MATHADPLGPDGWQRAWREAGAQRVDDTLRDVLLASYQEPHRGYHTLQHLRECLALLPHLSQQAERPAEIALALWFHDAIYDPARHDNEQRSADWARSAAWACGAPDEVAQRLHSLVMATRHAVEPVGVDAGVLVDIDLAILGAPGARFDEYERQVRTEYALVDDHAFRAGRLRVLQQFAERPRLYATAAAHRRFERAARANLARSIAALLALPAASEER
ncbi:HD domain-containing protein [Aquabacterium humicola]|uniref:HD domain-containing protein n=1 Tax=Aquabacterium humicola TaxID=3237377 RepID=UPI002542846A|nr:N-methyl-D-aspartate receptor NMDAR2C subunit [Rubrivivax pictus]